MVGCTTQNVQKMTKRFIILTAKKGLNQLFSLWCTYHLTCLKTLGFFVQVGWETLFEEFYKAMQVRCRLIQRRVLAMFYNVHEQIHFLNLLTCQINSLPCEIVNVTVSCLPAGR